MKKLIYGVTFLALVGITIVGCEKYQEDIVSKKQDNQNQEDITNQDAKTAKSKPISPLDLFASRLIDLNKYLNDSETQSGNTFFNYWLSNPNSTLSDLEKAGYIRKSTILKKFRVIESAARSIDDDDVVWKLITKNMDSRFYDNGNGEPLAGRICIFCCTGCMDGIKHNACYTSLFWTWGPGC